ncbi:hypothetical protein C1701_23335 [Actinoalloteichus sp. AHMU CJ021]|uniref:HAD-IIIC family phosphatase n=1 Tax=Actinoalloteichus TaxID=65496 RepID=UPI000CA04B1D|nr:hypothetical protein C1701_23335 [Actinoalloteichus sp. AHMU CJ021]
MSENGTTVKCLVWDLDNTLWRGILLEDGDVSVSGEILEVVQALDARGILQAVASKNDHDHAWARLERLGIAEYFVLAVIGWGPKSRSVRSIAERLNFAHHTIAFVDDQPTERAEVAFHLPDVRCYPAEEATSFPALSEFTPRSTTVDSARRRAMVQAQFRREAERSEFAGPDVEFLRTLDLDLRLCRATESELSRVEELTLRTSQMNATGVHYSDESLRDLLDDENHDVLVATLSDRFGTHGAISVVLLERHLTAWHLKLLATSCRVVSFGVGGVILNWIEDQAAQNGAHLVADFRRTERNRMMEVAYRFAGFDNQDCACRAEIGPSATEGVRQLHLRAARRESPDTLRLTAPDLAHRPGEAVTPLW